MCGISGVYRYQGAAGELERCLSVMNRALIHRGPDEEGIYVDPELRAGLGVRRLSIVDPEHGSQPLFSEDRSVVVVCNGEIYNHRGLRRELERKGHRFRSHSDCEVLVHLYEEHGVDFLKRLNGMFALALLDIRRRTLLLARDPVGMKHLYWARVAGGFAFASEARALFAAGLATPEPDWNALASYFFVGWVPSPGTAFRGLRRLRPGSYVLLGEREIREERYWIPRYQEPDGSRGERDYADELRELLGRAVDTHLDADVPAGLFLSGGWDSSLVSLYASRRSKAPLKSFSLVFPDDPAADESHYFRQVARQIGVQSQEIEVRDSDIRGVLRQTTIALEEPLVTVPALLTYMLSRSAGHELKLVLGGEGSDEIFAGYERFANHPLQRLRGLLPHTLIPDSIPLPMGRRWRRALRFLAARNDEEAHLELFFMSSSRQMVSLLEGKSQVARHPVPELANFTQATRETFRDSLDMRLCLEMTGRLADGSLFAADKNGMANSLEIRMPFLDLDVVEFAHRLPSRYKIRNGLMKAVLSGLALELPRDVAIRKKQGLHVPARMHLSPVLRDFHVETILETSLSTGLFDHGRLERWVRRQAANPGPRASSLWPLCHFCLWWNEFIKDGAKLA